MGNLKSIHNFASFSSPQARMRRKDINFDSLRKRELKKRADLSRLAYDLRYFLGDSPLNMLSPKHFWDVHGEEQPR